MFALLTIIGLRVILEQLVSLDKLDCLVSLVKEEREATPEKMVNLDNL